MAISDTEFDRILKLSWLTIDEKNRTKFKNQIDNILDFVSQLKEVDVEWIEPMAHPLEWKNLEMSNWVVESNFKEYFKKNVNHEIENDWIVIQTVLTN